MQRRDVSVVTRIDHVHPYQGIAKEPTRLDRILCRRRHRKRQVILGRLQFEPEGGSHIILAFFGMGYKPAHNNSSGLRILAIDNPGNLAFRKIYAPIREPERPPDNSAKILVMSGIRSNIDINNFVRKFDFLGKFILDGFHIPNLATDGDLTGIAIFAKKFIAIRNLCRFDLVSRELHQPVCPQVSNQASEIEGHAYRRPDNLHIETHGIRSHI